MNKAVISTKLNPEVSKKLGNSRKSSHQNYFSDLFTQITVDAALVGELIHEKIKDHLESDVDLIDEKYEADMWIGDREFDPLTSVNLGDLEFEISASIRFYFYPGKNPWTHIASFKLWIYEDGEFIASNFGEGMPIEFDESLLAKSLIF